MLVVYPGSNLFDLIPNKAPELKVTIDFKIIFLSIQNIYTVEMLGAGRLLKAQRTPVFRDFSLKQENLKIK